MGLNVALILASGTSSRFGSLIPKQYFNILGSPILCWSMRNFINSSIIHKVLLVINPEHLEFYSKLAHLIDHPKVIGYEFGGTSRQQSVLRGLRHLKQLNPENILIHDAARPFVSHKIINSVLEKLKTYTAVDVSLPVTDSIKKMNNGNILIANRDEFYLSQTPQGFKFAQIFALHQKATKQYTDDISMFLDNGLEISTIEGDTKNIKITHKSDIAKLNDLDLIKNTTTRIGIGFDVHKFAKPSLKSFITVCGIKIPYSSKIIAHSDGDVGFHALTDALLGAMSLGSIGTIFPNTDNKYKNINSTHFLEYVQKELQNRNGTINNIDIIIIAEAPKIMPHAEKMRHNIAEILKISVEKVNVKATTTEGMGFIGEKQGIAAKAVCSIEM